MTDFDKIRSVIAIIALVAVSFLKANNILFLHFHNFEDGSTVVHAHPYNNTDEDKHKHTEKELIFISLINSVLLQVIIATIVLCSLYNQLVPKTSKPFFLSVIADIIIGKNKARPPPPLSQRISGI